MRGNLFADQDQDGICDDVDDCIGVLDACGVCNGNGAVFECGCNDIPEGACDCFGTPCGDLTQILEIPNPFLELPYVQGAAPFISSYTGWFDADFIKVGICQPFVTDTSNTLTSNFSLELEFEGEIGSEQLALPASVNGFNNELILDLPIPGLTSSQVTALSLTDANGTVLDRLFKPNVPLSQVSIGVVEQAPGSTVCSDSRGCFKDAWKSTKTSGLSAMKTKISCSTLPGNSPQPSLFHSSPTHKVA